MPSITPNSHLSIVWGLWVRICRRKLRPKDRYGAGGKDRTLRICLVSSVSYFYHTRHETGERFFYHAMYGWAVWVLYLTKKSSCSSSTHSLAVWLWKSFSTSLHIHFSICNIKIVTLGISWMVTVCYSKCFLHVNCFNPHDYLWDTVSIS